VNIPVEVSEENLSIEVTTRCTSACRHCFARAGRKNDVELTRKDVEGIITEGIDTGFRYLHLTGGEPLLWPGLFSVMEEALSLGYKGIFLNSNGHLIDENRAEELASFGDPLHVSISLQGPEGHHDSFRGPGSFQKAMSGARISLEKGVKLHIFTTVDRNLLKDLPLFVDDTCRHLSGIESHTLIQLVRVHGDFFNLNDDLLRPEDFIHLVKMASLLMLTGYPVALLENPLATAAAHLLGLDWMPSSHNLHRKGRLVILADKTMTPAHSTRDSFGVYQPGALKGVMKSELYHRNTGEETGLCRSCSFSETCRKAGMLRPSEWFRDTEEKPYCVRVLERVASSSEQ
jgi:MoaA/NifB/PqqE/SkfB family radical SAM enzyme